MSGALPNEEKAKGWILGFRFEASPQESNSHLDFEESFMLRNNQVQVFQCIFDRIHQPCRPFFIPHNFFPITNTSFGDLKNHLRSWKRIDDFWKQIISSASEICTVGSKNPAVEGGLTLRMCRVGFSGFYTSQELAFSSSLGACAFCIAAVGKRGKMDPGNWEKKPKRTAVLHGEGPVFSVFSVFWGVGWNGNTWHHEPEAF